MRSSLLEMDELQLSNPLNAQSLPDIEADHTGRGDAQLPTGEDLEPRLATVQWLSVRWGELP
ncbi:MAG: hypothetical protein ACTMII_10105 [Brachybacterium sp.]|uniref:hypothetical protein n=1 Tax=unclassified Brachybacterium TaxID=2623841 RepID=UPI003F92A4D5